MPAPVAVYVVAAIAGVAAVLAFNEFVFEPHIAPAIERWAEDFLAKRRSRRRGPVSVPVSSARGPGDADPPSAAADTRKRTPPQGDSIELDGFNLGLVDEWRNEVHRSGPGTGLKRRTRLVPDTDQGSISTTIDESFPSLSHTPLAPTHVISNVSSPFTETLSVATCTPTRSPTHSRAPSPIASEGEHEGNIAPSSPTSTISASSPFGPILPDTQTTYAVHPFSPVVPTQARSRAPSRTSSSSLRRSTITNAQGRHFVIEEHVQVDVSTNVHVMDASASVLGDGSPNSSSSGSAVGSLSERYPAPPSPPVMLSPPSSQIQFSSPTTDVMSFGSSGSRSASPFHVVSPPMQHTALSGASAGRAGTGAAPSLTSDDEFMSLGEASDVDPLSPHSQTRSESERGWRDVQANEHNHNHIHNPFLDFEAGSDYESGSEGSWGRV